jgi:hypothetical protein
MVRYRTGLRDGTGFRRRCGLGVCGRWLVCEANVEAVLGAAEGSLSGAVCCDLSVEHEGMTAGVSRLEWRRDR